MKNFFNNPNGKRPERLDPATRDLARRMLCGENGRYLTETEAVAIDDSAAYAAMSVPQKQLCCVQAVAAKAPIRLIEGEYLAGSATLGAAKHGYTPACLAEKMDDPDYDGRFDWIGTNHVTLGFEKALKIGYKGIRKELLASLETFRAMPESAERNEKIDTLEAMYGCLEAASLWHERNMKALESRIETSLGPIQRRYKEIYENLRNVPENPPTNFKEALQSLWFMFAFLRLTGNWPGIGRIDKMLGGFLKEDLAAGRITLDEAREYIAHFWIKGAEWCNGDHQEVFGGSGDGQYYQNIILAGLDEEGHDVTNEVTYLVLDVIEELGISDYPVSVRLRPDSDPRLYRRVAEVMKLGGGILAIYNDQLVIDSLVDFGYPVEEARNFTNDGCWEIQIPGATCFRYYSYDLLGILQRDVLKMDEEGPSHLPYKSFDELFAAFSAAGKAYLQTEIIDKTPEMLHLPFNSLFASLLTEGCFTSGRQYWDGGARYLVFAAHPGGMPDTANALLALKKLVYDDKTLTLDELVDILKANWEGYETLRLTMRNKVTYYGNDDDTADAMMVRVYDDFIDSLHSLKSIDGYLNPAGISTFGKQIKWSHSRYATPDGHKAGEYLAHNIDPTPGTDLQGATAVVKSLTKMDLRKLPNGTPLTLRLLPSVVRGADGVEAVESLLRGFVSLGGIFLQFDILDVEALKEAQKNPDEYASLSVRVSGWSARFNTLNKEFQNMIIQSTGQDA